MKAFFILMLNIPLFVFGQINLEGKVLDCINSQPVAFATVFINGTTHGTTTDSTGAFILNNISIPTQVVVSHLSYSTKMTSVNNTNLKDLIIELDLKKVELPEALVVDKNLRQDNINEFKRLFLGSDHWGENAILKNDGSLIFSRSYTQTEIMVSDSIRKKINWEAHKDKDIIRWKEDGKNIIVKVENIINWNEDSTKLLVKEPIFKVAAKQPLIIDMPLLGYELQVELVDFTAKSIGGHAGCVFLGYYYFQPYTTESKLKTKKHERNRQAVFYNSTQHFFRSLFANRLEENGFKIVEGVDNNEINMDTFLKPIKENEREIVGLKNRNLTVRYHCKMNGNPVDITEKKAPEILQSKIIFLSDTCKIRADGTIPESNILFGGKIGAKKVGSMLPSNFNDL